MWTGKWDAEIRPSRLRIKTRREVSPNLIISEGQSEAEEYELDFGASLETRAE